MAGYGGKPKIINQSITLKHYKQFPIMQTIILFMYEFIYIVQRQTSNKHLL